MAVITLKTTHQLVTSKAEAGQTESFLHEFSLRKCARSAAGGDCPKTGRKVDLQCAEIGAYF